MWEIIQQAIIAYPAIIKWFVIGFFAFIISIVLAICLKFKLFHSLSLSRKGVTLTAMEKEKEKQYQSRNIEHLLRDQIQKCDMELIDYALEKSTILRRGLSIILNKGIGCSSMRKALSSSLRYPLLHAAMRNNFKYVLRPENINFYIDRLMKEINFEYEEFAIEHTNSYCVVDNSKKCPELPLWENINEVLKQRLIDDWALPIRQKNIDMCQKKIGIYRGFVKSFEELGDIVMVKSIEDYIDKNRMYADAFIRKPELRTN